VGKQRSKKTTGAKCWFRDENKSGRDLQSNNTISVSVKPEGHKCSGTNPLVSKQTPHDNDSSYPLEFRGEEKKGLEEEKS